jgi:hypothetical protein
MWTPFSRMADGRTFSAGTSDATLDEQLRQRENIRTNWDYRIYLQENASSIMKLNQTESMNYKVPTYIETPSDLKQSYLSKEQLQKNMKPVILTQEELLRYARAH